MEYEIYNSNNEMSLIKSNGPFLLQTADKTQNPINIIKFEEIKGPTFVGEKLFFGNYKIVGEQIKIEKT